MKRQEWLTYQQKTDSEINQAIKEWETKIADLSMKMTLSKVKNVHEAKTLRLGVARLKTILRSRALGEKAKKETKV